MLAADGFAGPRLFVRRGFLDTETCRSLRGAMASATRTPATVRLFDEASTVLDATVRRTSEAELSGAAAALVRDRLLAMVPALERHFDVCLAGYQGPHFYVYDEGDFFLAHRDRDTDPGSRDAMKARQISASIFLNDGVAGPARESYDGGAFVFHAAGDSEGEQGLGWPLQADEGTFVAFRSDCIHEVQPITRGRRYSIVAWYF